MRVGLTFDLRDDYLAAGASEEEAGEFDFADTIDAIETVIAHHGHVTDRIGRISSLVKKLADGETWDLVFNIAEGSRGFAREAQIPALLEAYDIPFTFSAPNVLVSTMDKSLAKLIVREAGVHTPDFVVVRKTEDVEAVRLPFPLFAKPIAEGTSKGIHASSWVPDIIALRERCKTLLEVYKQPVLVEAYLPGAEYTVGLLGAGDAARVLGVCRISYRDGADPLAFTHRNKMESFEKLSLVSGDFGEEVGNVALEAWRALGCRDAGRVDIRCDDRNRPSFLEANPIAGLRPNWSELTVLAELAGLSYVELIGAILSEASQRV